MNKLIGFKSRIVNVVLDLLDDLMRGFGLDDITAINIESFAKFNGHTVTLPVSEIISYLISSVAMSIWSMGAKQMVSHRLGYPTCMSSLTSNRNSLMFLPLFFADASMHGFGLDGVAANYIEFFAQFNDYTATTPFSVRVWFLTAHSVEISHRL